MLGLAVREGQLEIIKYLVTECSVSVNGEQSTEFCTRTHTHTHIVIRRPRRSCMGHAVPHTPPSGPSN